MSLLVALAQAPELDPVIIKEFYNSLNFDQCNDDIELQLTDKYGKKHKTSLKELRQRALASLIAKAIRISPNLSDGVLSNNYQTLRLYLSSFDTLEILAQNIQGEDMPLPQSGSPPSPELMGILQDFIQERAEAVTMSCKLYECWSTQSPSSATGRAQICRTNMMSICFLCVVQI